MPTDSPYPAPFDTSTFIFPAEWHAFSDLLGGADTGLLFLRDGVIIHVNTHLAQQLGYEDAELVGQPVESLFPSGNGQSREQGSESEHLRLMTKTGEPIDFHFIANRIDTLTDARCVIWVLHPERQEDKQVSTHATRMQAITAQLPDLVMVCGPDTALNYVNESFTEIAGTHNGMLINHAHQEDRAKLRSAFNQAVTGNDASLTPIAFRLQHRDGSWRYLAGQMRNLLAHPDVGGLLLTARDVTDEMQRQQEIAAEKKRQLHYLNRLFRLAQRPHANLNSALKVILKSAAKALGAHRASYWDVSDNPGETRCILTYDDKRQNFVDEAPDAHASTEFHPLLQQVLRSEHQLAVADVDQDPRAALCCEYFHAMSIKALMLMPVERAGKPSGMLMLSNIDKKRQWRKDETDFLSNVASLITLIFREVERGRSESRLRHLAHHDSLTGLPNRHFLFDQSADFFPKVTAKANTLAAFFIDLDGFKSVNDSLGHAMGDELLKAAAMRLQNVVRKDDILVRLGGDEFMLLARNLSNMNIADDIAAQIVDTMRGTFSLQGRELQISASVGIALYPFDGTDIDTLMKKADIAMYHAKSAGRDQYQMFAPHLNDGMSNRSALEAELRRAIDERELQHYYQPQIDLKTGKVRCVEALLRWRHPRLGVLLPDSFLAVAEESGMIHDISAWVMNDACDQLSAWTAQGLDEFNLAINLSSSQLMDRALLSVLENALQRTGVAARRLEWEVKESTVMQHHTMTSSMLDRVTGMDIGLSIDDFGTGYSNMAYLRRYPVHKVKIDSSFVNGLPGEGDDRAITDAIISMAQPLGLDVVAEGVETPQQIEYLREHGCDFAQGYFFTQPLTAEQLQTWLIRH
jgi:diguanylate cyclase (GGDEF)-like protein/PAS domain S-box-containing protein